MIFNVQMCIPALFVVCDWLKKNNKLFWLITSCNEIDANTAYVDLQVSLLFLS